MYLVKGISIKTSREKINFCRLQVTDEKSWIRIRTKCPGSGHTDSRLTDSRLTKHISVLFKQPPSPPPPPPPPSLDNKIVSGRENAWLWECESRIPEKRRKGVGVSLTPTWKT
jgi:hypothetical protein